MKNDLHQETPILRRILENKALQKRQWIITFLASVVIFITTYALILPAITWERSLICDIKAHIHTDECYDGDELICGLEEHVHTDACFDAPPDEPDELYCGKQEHVHTESCYTYDGLLQCELEEHVHDHLCRQPVVRYAEEDDLLPNVIHLLAPEKMEQPRKMLKALRRTGSEEDESPFVSAWDSFTSLLTGAASPFGVDPSDENDEDEEPDEPVPMDIWNTRCPSLPWRTAPLLPMWWTRLPPNPSNIPIPMRCSHPQRVTVRRADPWVPLHGTSAICVPMKTRR